MTTMTMIMFNNNIKNSDDYVDYYGTIIYCDNITLVIVMMSTVHVKTR